MCLKLYKLITSLFKVANSRQPTKPGKFKLAGSYVTDKVNYPRIVLHPGDTEQTMK